MGAEVVLNIFSGYFCGQILAQIQRRKKRKRIWKLNFVTKNYRSCSSSIQVTVFALSVTVL